jgi:hypothetical protein
MDTLGEGIGRRVNQRLDLPVRIDLRLPLLWC